MKTFIILAFFSFSSVFGEKLLTFDNLSSRDIKECKGESILDCQKVVILINSIWKDVFGKLIKLLTNNKLILVENL